MRLNPYLTFNGNCEEAFKFYEQCLGATIEVMHTHEGSPMPDNMPPEWQKKILHVRMAVDDNLLMGSDAPPEHYEQPKGFSVSLDFDKLADAERAFHALAENGTVQMPFQKTFWAAGGFGMLVDRFRVPWMVNCEKPA
jgi:PhnB protein